MDIAVIAHKLHRAHVLKIFKFHPEFKNRINCFVDWEERDTEDGEDEKKIPIISLNALSQYKYDIILIAVPWPGRVNQLFLKLHDMKITGEVYAIRPTMIESQRDFINSGKFDDSIVDKIPMSDERPFLSLLETHVCDDCNLNCKACTHFAPFVKERKKADIEKFESSLHKASELFSGIGLVSILGGEALLEPELCIKMLQLSRKYFPKSGVMLTTNGLLMPKMKASFWESIKENNCIVNVTPYPPTVKMIPTILDILCKYDIKYDPRLETSEIKTFAKYMSLNDIYDAHWNNEMCAAAGCYQYQDGYIGKCPTGMYIDFMADSLGMSPLDLKTKDAVNILEADDGFDVLRKLCAPSDMCRKCAKKLRKDVCRERIDKTPDPDDWLIRS